MKKIHIIHIIIIKVNGDYFNITLIAKEISYFYS